MSLQKILKNFPSELSGAVDILEEEYHLTAIFADRELNFIKGDALSVKYEGKIINIIYDSAKSAMRGLGFAMANASADGEKNTFEKFGVMIDCSRNAVLHPEALRFFLRNLIDLCIRYYSCQSN